MARRQIISASRRTDIPAFHAAWLADSLKTGEVECENPVSRAPYRVDLRPGSVHTLVLWSRNFLPLLDHWDSLGPYRLFCMQTLTGLPRWLEPGGPPREEALEGARRLAGRLPPGALVWRFDPVLLGPACPEEERLGAFSTLAPEFAAIGVRRIIISFLTAYRHLRGVLPDAYLHRPDQGTRRRVAARLAEEAARHGMSLSLCADPDLHGMPGLDRAGCIDARVLEGIYGPGAPAARDRGQRRDCRCTRSRDIGSYRQVCGHGCLYCYAGRTRGAGA